MAKIVDQALHKGAEVVGFDTKIDVFDLSLDDDDIDIPLTFFGILDILPALKREDSTVGVRLRRFPGGNLRVCMLLVGTVSAW